MGRYGFIVSTPVNIPIYDPYKNLKNSQKVHIESKTHPHLENALE